MGAFGDPRVPTNIHAKEILLGMRFKMDLYANVRPVRLLDSYLSPLKAVEPKDVDFVVIRENTEGVYVDRGGISKQGSAEEVAVQEDVNTRKGVERIIRFAFEYCKTEKRADGSALSRVLLCDKSNAMTYAGSLWQRVFKLVAAEYPELKAEHMYVDALCTQMVRDPRPFDVIVTNNMFGDIISDLGAGLQGGLGMAASGNIHPGKDVDVRAGAWFGADDCRQESSESDRRNPQRSDDAQTPGTGGGITSYRSRSGGSCAPKTNDSRCWRDTRNEGGQ